MFLNAIANIANIAFNQSKDDYIDFGQIIGTSCKLVQDLLRKSVLSIL